MKPLRPVGGWLLLAHEAKRRAPCRTQAMRSGARRKLPPPTAHSAVGRWTQGVLNLDVLRKERSWIRRHRNSRPPTRRWWRVPGANPSALDELHED